MTVWFTADLHLGHRNIVKYCQRPFMTPQEEEQARQNPRGKFRISDATLRRHDNGLIKAINDWVGEEDVLWVLGDFCWGGKAQANLYLKRIRCRHVYLFWGNHDDRSIRPAFQRTYEEAFITVAGQVLFLSHAPRLTWKGAAEGSWHLYGDVHGHPVAAHQAKDSLTKDVGVDACDYRPWSLEDIQKYLRRKRLHGLH